MLLASRNIAPNLKKKTQPPSTVLCWVTVSFHSSNLGVLVFIEVRTGSASSLLFSLFKPPNELCLTKALPKGRVKALTPQNPSPQLHRPVFSQQGHHGLTSASMGLPASSPAEQHRAQLATPPSALHGDASRALTLLPGLLMTGLPRDRSVKRARQLQGGERRFFCKNFRSF